MPVNILHNSFTGLQLDGTTTIDGQIAFPAAQSASAGVNVLDDYEEGTWTAQWSGTTVAGTGTWTSNIGRYHKIGNVVRIDFWISWTAHTGTGNISLTGLPFATSATAGQDFALNLYIANISVTGKFIQLNCASGGVTTMALTSYTDTTGASTAVPVTAYAGGGVTGSLIGSGIYII